ncbi:MAG TPA: hypothetical protein VMT52_18920 [Planctomycetota bacterium]|nr:hypothetical protein [Planctomycetota bacterium]
MSQREDLMFCKIAITNGLVTEGDAQKVLALCNKREIEAGQRPRIGAVFTKYNLMRADDVQRIYQAVQKRTGGELGGTAVQRNGRGRGRGLGTATGRRPSARGRAARSGKSIDRQTLWMGIGGLVVAVLLIGTLFYLVLRPAGGSKPSVASTTAGASLETPPPAPFEPTPSAKQPAAASPAVGAKQPSPAGRPATLTRETLQELNTLLGDVRRDASDDPAAARARLELEKKKFEDKGYDVPAILLEALQEIPENGGGGGTAGADVAVPDAGAAAEPDAAAEPPEDTRSEDDDLGDLLEE